MSLSDIISQIINYLPAVISFIFFCVILSYYILLFIKIKKPKIEKQFKSITIIIPAHNEERYIKACINSILNAKFTGDKEIIVINDGSHDRTSEIVKKIQLQNKIITLLETQHSGKSKSINRAIKIATGELIAIVDGDSEIHQDALVEISQEIGRTNIAGACCPVRVKNRKIHLMMWVHIEQIYNSLMRFIMSKVNANVTTPGPLSAYRKDALIEIGGFSEEGFSEDVDITIRLIRKGYKIGFAEKAIAETNMPYDPKGFLRQRTRFARGMLNIFKRHLKLNTKLIDIYTMPLLLFTYIQAVIMGMFTIYQITHGYYLYFLSKGTIISFGVIKYLLDWTSIIGFVKWTLGIFLGTTELNIINLIGILAGLLSYPLYFYAIYKFDKGFDLWHLIPIFFMAPFWWLIMIIYILCLPEMFIKKQYNIWKKNE